MSHFSCSVAAPSEVKLLQCDPGPQADGLSPYITESVEASLRWTDIGVRRDAPKAEGFAPRCTQGWSQTLCNVQGLDIEAC